MPRFTRFVAVTSVLLFLLYLFYPISIEHVTESITPNSPAPPTNKVEPVGQSLEVQTTSKDAASKDPQQRPLSTEPLSLRDKLATVFPYDLNSVFPSFIWQTWKTTPSDPDFEFREAEASWTERHSGYIHEVITDDVAALLIKHLYSSVPEVLEAYDALPKAILKADFFRYLILLARGGVYSDIDTQVIRPVWEWVPDELALERYGLVIGIEADPDRADWADWYSRRMQFCQWTIRSKAGHPALLEVVARLTEKTLEMKATKSLETDGLKSIVEWTGPAMWTDAIFDYLNSNPTQAFEPARTANVSWRNLTGMTEARRLSDVVILPITGFSPGQGHMGSKPFDDPHAMVKHDFEGSWKPESERMHDEEHGWIVTQS